MIAWPHADFPCGCVDDFREFENKPYARAGDLRLDQRLGINLDLSIRVILLPTVDVDDRVDRTYKYI